MKIVRNSERAKRRENKHLKKMHFQIKNIQIKLIRQFRTLKSQAAPNENVRTLLVKSKLQTKIFQYLVFFSTIRNTS